MKAIITALSLALLLTACSAEKSSALSDVELITTCQMAIKPQLKNPKSMDLDLRQTAVTKDDEGKALVKMYYYAENGFGATPLSVVNCSLDKDGNLLEYQQIK